MNILNSKFIKITFLFIALMTLYFFNIGGDVNATTVSNEKRRQG